MGTADHGCEDLLVFERLFLLRMVEECRFGNSSDGYELRGHFRETLLEQPDVAEVVDESFSSLTVQLTYIKEEILNELDVVSATIYR